MSAADVVDGEPGSRRGGHGGRGGRASGRRRGARGGYGAFPEALRGEWVKLFTVPSTYWSLLAGVGLSAGLTVAVALAVVADPAFPSRTGPDPLAYSFVGVSLGALPFGVLGVLTITGEYASGTIRTSLAVIPRRRDLLAAKATALAATAFVGGEVAVVSSFLLGQAVYRSHGFSTALMDPAILRALVGGGVYLTMVSLLAFGIGTVVRRTAGSVSTVVAILFVLPAVGATMSGEPGRLVNALLPSHAGGAIVTPRAADGSLPAWVALVVLAIYTAAALGTGLVLFERRDP